MSLDLHKIWTIRRIVAIKKRRPDNLIHPPSTRHIFYLTDDLLTQRAVQYFLKIAILPTALKRM